MRTWTKAVAAMVGALLAAAAARADELYATVDRTAAPGERALVRLRSDAPGPATLLAYRVEAPAALLDAGLDLHRGAEVYARLKGALDAARAAAGNALPRLPDPAADGPDAPPPLSARLTFVLAKTASLAAPAPGVPTDEHAPKALPEAVVEMPLPASGVYVVEVRQGERATAVTAVASRLALVEKRDPAGVLCFAVDRTTGRAIEGVAVEARDGGKVVAAGKTDAKGLARLEAAGHPTLETRGVVGDDVAFGVDSYFPASVADRRVYAFTHQPAYRPGERVEARGVVRAWRDGQYALDAEVREVEATLRGAGGRDLGTVKAPVSGDLGTFACGFDLPEDAPTGDATLVVVAGGKRYDAPLRIEAYRKPTFEVRVTTKAARADVGGDVAFDVEGALFEGGPLAGASFTWSLAWNRVDRELFPTDEIARLFFGTEREAYAPVPLATGAGILDAAGRARVAAKAPTKSEDGFLTLRVVATGPDRTQVAGSGGLPLVASPLTVALKTDKHLYGAEATAVVTVKALLADGAPAKGRAGVLTASLVGEAAGSARVREERQVGSWPFTTGDDGTAKVSVPFAENGRFALAAALPRTAEEPPGPPAHAMLHVWVVGERADVGFSGDRLEVIADKDAYAIGDRARLLVLSPAGARPFLSTLEGARILSFDTVALGGADDRGAAAVVEVEIRPEHVPNAYVGVALVDHGNLLSTEKLLRVPPVARLLVPTVTPAKTELLPGETVAMTARVADASGAPVANAEVSVAVVDDALYALYADPAAPIAPFFHPVRRNDVRTGGPLHVESVGFDVLRSPPRKEAVPAEGADADGGAGAPRERRLGEAPAAGAVPAPASPRPGAPATGALPDASRMSCGAGKCGGGDDATGLALPGVRSIGTPSEETGPGGAGEGPLTAREDFRTAVAWSPALRTGADGTVAVAEVKFAQTLTRWRITAVAVDAATRVGSSTTTVRTAKKVMTRLTLPRFLRATDGVDAPWILHSLLPADAEARFVAGATGLEIQGAHEGREVLKAGAVVSHDLRLFAPAVGEGRVTAELRTDAGTDAFTAKIPILPQGIPKTLLAQAVADGGPVTLGKLDLPPNAERGSARLKVTVAPSVAQAVGAALPYLADYPYGCTEQTMSRLVPVVVAKAARDAFHAPLQGRLAEIPKMLDAGLARLRALQHEDGGFGWWPTDASDPYMTAYVVHGLTRARAVAADPAPVQALLARATPWVLRWLAAPGKDGRSEGAPEAAVLRAFAWMALADAGALPEGVLPPAARDGAVTTPPLARAFLLRAMLTSGQRADEAPVHVAELAARATRDATGVHWGSDAATPSRWADDPVETTAWVLGALLAADAKHPDLSPGVRWLLGARVGGSRWRSTRDTAAAVAFLTRYAAATGDLGAGKTVALSMNGLRLRSVTVTPENAFSDAAVVEVDAAGLPRGPIELTATPESGTATVSAALSFVETGPAIAAATAGFEVKRTWWLLEPVKAGSGVMRRKPVTETVPSGTLLDVDVTVTTTEDREFVMVTSPHAAGFEPTKDYGTTYETPPPPAAATDHVETRDDRTVFFAKRLPAGTHVFRHRVVATHVGSFTALPAQAELMYFPEVRGNAAGETLEISAAGAAGTPSEGR